LDWQNDILTLVLSTYTTNNINKENINLYQKNDDLNNANSIYNIDINNDTKYDNAKIFNESDELKRNLNIFLQQLFMKVSHPPWIDQATELPTLSFCDSNSRDNKRSIIEEDRLNDTGQDPSDPPLLPCLSYNDHENSGRQSINIKENRTKENKEAPVLPTSLPYNDDDDNRIYVERSRVDHDENIIDSTFLPTLSLDNNSSNDIRKDNNQNNHMNGIIKHDTPLMVPTPYMSPPSPATAQLSKALPLIQPLLPLSLPSQPSLPLSLPSSPLSQPSQPSSPTSKSAAEELDELLSSIHITTGDHISETYNKNNHRNNISDYIIENNDCNDNCNKDEITTDTAITALSNSKAIPIDIKSLDMTTGNYIYRNYDRNDLISDDNGEHNDKLIGKNDCNDYVENTGDKNVSSSPERTVLSGNTSTTYIYTYTYMHMYLKICIKAYMNIYANTYMHIYICKFRNNFMNTYICIYIHIYVL
jgi:hypothetical protein